jgi:hypothetical protein
VTVDGDNAVISDEFTNTINCFGLRKKLDESKLPTTFLTFEAKHVFDGYYRRGVTKKVRSVSVQTKILVLYSKYCTYL